MPMTSATSTPQTHPSEPTGTSSGGDGGPRWNATRRTPRLTDRTLVGATRLWLRRLPPGRRPLRLCATHPRVANRVAWCWGDPTLSLQVLDDLLVDRRGGRTGFSESIVAELRRLRQFNAQRTPRS